MLKNKIKQFFCAHDFELINQFTMKSEYDIIVDSGKTPNTWNSLTRVIISDYKCSKCNKLKRLKAKN